MGAMRMSMRKAIVACLAAAGTVAIGGTIGPASPAGAETNAVGDAWVSGDFTGDERDEVFDYVGGATADFLVSFDVVGDTLTTTENEFAVNGNYLPVAGDFDGDGKDEIFWYGPGATTDSMWHFQSSSSAVAVPYSVGGVYQPIVGDFTADGVEDIFWYAPGTAGDPLWDFNPGGTRTSTARNVNGTYTPVAVGTGSDDTTDILWYGPGGVTDSIWNFVPGTTNYQVQAVPVNGVYQPISIDAWGDGPFGTDILWYAADAPQQPFWDFLFGSRFNDVIADSPGPGDHEYVAGDYFGDDSEDVLWRNATHIAMWDFFIVDEGGIPVLTYIDYDSNNMPAGADARTSSGQAPESRVGAALNGTTAGDSQTVASR